VTRFLTPEKCDPDPSNGDTWVVETHTIPFKNATLMAVETTNGDIKWARRHTEFERITHMACMTRSKGVIGCGDIAYSNRLFHINKQGDTQWVYDFDVSEPQYCAGLYYRSNEVWGLFSSSAPELSRSENYDPIVIHFDADGEVNLGSVFTFESRVNLGRGIALDPRGGVFFAGSVRSTHDYDFQYYSFFIMKMHVYEQKYTCITQKTTPKGNPLN